MHVASSSRHEVLPYNSTLWSICAKLQPPLYCLCPATLEIDYTLKKVCKAPVTHAAVLPLSHIRACSKKPKAKIQPTPVKWACVYICAGAASRRWGFFSSSNQRARKIPQEAADSRPCTGQPKGGRQIPAAPGVRQMG